MASTAHTNRAILLTVDSNVGDFRQSVEKMKGTTGDALPSKKMGPFTHFPQGPHDPTLNWGDLVWLKEVVGEVPIYLKGVSSIEVGPTGVKHTPYSTLCPAHSVQHILSSTLCPAPSENSPDLIWQDVRLAKECGVKGCILSNHGGRQLDR